MTETPSRKNDSGNRESGPVHADDKREQSPRPKRPAKQNEYVCMVCGKAVGKRDRTCPHCGTNLILG